jgi:hypothetical protein
VALPALAEVRNLEDRMRRSFETDEDLSWAESVLNAASTLVRAESGKNWLDPDDATVVVAPDIIREIVIRVAERAIRNPDGLSSESAGDYSYQRNGVSGDGAMFLTDWELEMLRKVAGKGKLWTQQLTRGECYDSTEWVWDNFGTEPFPMGSIPRW